METHMEKICEVCGSDSVGFQDLIATCSRCSSTREHLYCMRVLTFEMPEDWVCDSCLPENEMNLVESGGKEDTLMSSSNIAQHDTNILSSRKRFAKSSWQFHSKKQKPVETGKVKFLNPDEVIALSSGAAKLKSPSKTYTSARSGPSNTMASLCRKNLIKARTVNPKSFPDRVEKATACIHSGPSKPSREGAVHKSPTIDKKVQRTSKEIKERSSPESGKWRAKQKQLIDFYSQPKDVEASQDKKDNFTEKSSCAPLSSRSNDPDNMRNVAPIITSENKKFGTLSEKMETELAEEAPCPQLPSSNLPCDIGGNANDLAEDNRSNVEAEEPENMQHAIVLYRTYFPTQLITWKGGFSIVDNTVSELIEGFQAQPPCRVHRKAYETSQKMPPVLQVKMLPRLHDSADLFRDSGAHLADISLYFFSSADNSERSRAMHNKLFDLMEVQRSIMIGYVNDIELLIFTSKQLNVDFQNAFSSKTKKFFWGVFRKREASNVKSLSEENEEKLEANNAKSLCEVNEKLGTSNVKSLCEVNEKNGASKVKSLCEVNEKKREGSDVKSLCEVNEEKLEASDVRSLCEVNEETVPMISPLACAYPDDQEIHICEDMEIDMVGGVDIGRIDVVIHKDSPTYGSYQPISTKGNVAEKQIVVSRETDSSVQQRSSEYKSAPKTEDQDKLSGFTKVVKQETVSEDAKFMASWSRLKDLCFRISPNCIANAPPGFPEKATGSSLGTKTERK